MPMEMRAAPQVEGVEPVSVPAFTLEWSDVDPGGGARRWSQLGARDLYVVDADMRPAAEFIEIGAGERFCVLGRPILGERFDNRGVCALLSAEGFADEALSQLNGEFLILHSPPDRRTLRAVTCRYGYPTFWVDAAQGRLTASTAFAEVWDRLPRQGRLDANPEAMFETLLFKRVLGDKSAARGVRLLGPAREWVFDGAEATERRYWRPDFRDKTGLSLPKAADSLIDLVGQSIRRRVAPGERLSLFLSGGMDTRLLAASFAASGLSPHCVTINAFENREVRVAREVAAIAGLEHSFIETPADHYRRTLPQAARLAAGMQMPMCMFHGHASRMAGIADVGFHGHGFDFMFQGMYLPKWQPRLMGRTLAYRRMAPAPSDVAGFFLDNVPYRLKGLNVLDVARPEAAKIELERIRAELEAQAADAREIADNEYDVYEQLTFSNLARHYSVSDHWGVNTTVEQRTIAFDNDLYGFYQSLPAALRFDARIQRMALRRLSPSLAALPSANHTFPIALSSGARTLLQARQAALRRLGLAARPKGEAFERMGLPQAHLFQHDWRPAMLELATSERMERLPFLDIGKLRNWARRAVEGEALPDGQFLALAMAQDQFLKTAE